MKVTAESMSASKSDTTSADSIDSDADSGRLDRERWNT
jgi:hypothetical protein